MKLNGDHYIEILVAWRQNLLPVEQLCFACQQVGLFTVCLTRVLDVEVLR